MDTDDLTPARLGTQLRRLRTGASLTQQQVADAIGMSRVICTNYERGRREPGLSTIAAWARACGHRLRINFPPPEDGDLSEPERRLLGAFRQMDERTQDLALAAAEAVARGAA